MSKVIAKFQLYPSELRREIHRQMKPTVLEQMWDLLGRKRRKFLFSVLLLILSNLAYVIIPLLFRWMQKSFQPPVSHLTLAACGIILLGLTALSSWFKFHTRKNFTDFSLIAEKELKQALFSKLERFSEAFYDQHTVGKLLNQLTQDMQLYKDMFRIGFLAPLNLITLIIPAFIALGFISWPLMLIAALPLFLVPIVMWRQLKRIYKLSIKREKEVDLISGFIHESYTGIKLIKAYGVEKGFVKHLKDLTNKLYNSSLWLHALESFSLPVVVTITRSVTLCLVVVSAFIIFKGYGTLSSSDFLAFMWIQSYFLYPVLFFGLALPLIQKGSGAYDRLYEVYSFDDPVKDLGDKKNHISHPPSIDVKNLNFSYPSKEELALDDISFKVEPGSSLGITGSLGSGKSTLLKLICRSYESEYGAITLNGIPLQDYPLKAIHQAMGMVQQTPFFLSESIEDNIRLGKENASDEEIRRALYEADLLETVQSFPSKEKTAIGERGVTLSGGEKKRLLLARTLIEYRPLLLIDDIFSALDVETEKRIFERIEAQLKKSTTLIISHKATFLTKLDYILFMANGKIIEQGTPKELLDKKGAFYSLYQLQKELA